MRPTTKNISIQDAAELLRYYNGITAFYGVVRKELNAADIINEATTHADQWMNLRDEYHIFDEGGSAVVYTRHGATILITRGRDNTITAYYLTNF